jgi:hypothetical protein
MLPAPMHRCAALIPVLALLCACGTARQWRELRTGPMKFAEAWQGLVEVAQGDGYIASPESDQGLGIYQSRWRPTNLGLGRPGRFRLRAEIEEGVGGEQGWNLRFCIERQRVKDLNRTFDPREEDWSWDGQDGEREAVLGERLRRRLQPGGGASRRT